VIGVRELLHVAVVHEEAIASPPGDLAKDPDPDQIVRQRAGGGLGHSDEFFDPLHADEWELEQAVQE
jgi:hypothetical protein